MFRRSEINEYVLYVGTFTSTYTSRRVHLQRNCRISWLFRYESTMSIMLRYKLLCTVILLIGTFD